MLEQFALDIIENDIVQLEQGLLGILLFDRSTRKNIIWATADYESLGEGYREQDEILPELITGEHTFLIQPRTAKSKEEQLRRIRDKAEVFTPTWICNQQNNLVDEAWFGRQNVFNSVKDKTWRVTREYIRFPEQNSRNWRRYVDAKRMEIACGEAPYIVSRYDAATGKRIPIERRVGLLDRKLRIVNENTKTKKEWIQWAVRAVQSVYGFEFQGDSLLLARENVFITFLEYHHDRYHKLPDQETMDLVARVVSWNLWQMDAMKYVVPYSCRDVIVEDYTLFGTKEIVTPCPGCRRDNAKEHNGIYCKIMDWRDKQSVRYVDLIRG